MRGYGFAGAGGAARGVSGPRGRWERCVLTVYIEVGWPGGRDEWGTADVGRLDVPAGCSGRGVAVKSGLHGGGMGFSGWRGA